LLNGNDICLEQIKLGMAWHYKPYESTQPKEDRAQYRQTEQDAKAGKVGLWNDKNPVPPWEFKRKEK